jgi:hypothetical protein
VNIQDDILRGFTEQVGDELIPEVMCAQHFYEVPETALHLFCLELIHLILGGNNRFSNNLKTKNKEWCFPNKEYTDGVDRN